MNSSQKTHRFNRVDVAYTTHNLPANHSKPVLIFIHGWCCSSALWTGQKPLYTSHPSVVIDLPGHGSSSKPEDVDYSIEFYARAIIAVLDAEDVKDVVFIGHSMGGVVATMILRMQGEERVKGIVYVSSFWLMPVHYLSASQRAATKEALKADAIMWSMFEPSFVTSKTEVVEQVRKVMVEETPQHVRLSICTDSLPQHWASAEVYAKTPMLHLTYAGAPEWDEQSSRHLPGLVVETWEGVSIFLHIDQPEKFNARVEEFLQENRLL
jgi:pimeloyl-ACP methyl ester carboxylesterase